MNETVHSAPKRADAHASPSRPPPRTNDPVRTMAGILDVATHEFAAKGLSGARIDEIAAATKTSKRMIYYYFGSKEALYVAVLEAAYRRMRTAEAELNLDELAPLEAIRTLVGWTFDHHHDDPDFVRLIMSENMQSGQYLARCKSIQRLNRPALAAVERLYQRGVAAGVFRDQLSAIDIHATISALTFFNVSNRYTFDLVFRRDSQSKRALAARREVVIDTIVRYLAV